MSQNSAWIQTVSGLSIFHNGKTYTVTKDHVNYLKILEKLGSRKFDELEELIDVKKSVLNYAACNTLKSMNTITVDNGEIYYKGVPLHNVMCEKLLNMYEQGVNIDPFLRFMENLMENPSKTAVDELYLFLERGLLPITEDGHFLAYKKVKHNYYDIYSGKFLHTPGAVMSMPRNEVDDNRERTCSTGFHFCSIEYLPSYISAGDGTNNDRVVIVKINPKDVVSIPSDYNNTKGRTCTYVVVGEYTGQGWREKKEMWNQQVVDERKSSENYQPAPNATVTPSLDMNDPMYNSYDDFDSSEPDYEENILSPDNTDTLLNSLSKIEEEVRSKKKTMPPRDPVTGRFLPKGW